MQDNIRIIKYDIGHLQSNKWYNGYTIVNRYHYISRNCSL